MKKILFSLALLIMFSGCGAQSLEEKFEGKPIISQEKLQERNNISYTVGDENPFTGIVKEPLPEGKWTNSYFDNGVKIGEIYFYANGTKESEGLLKDGKEDGLFTRWHENGQKKLETFTENGELEGVSTLWYENGQKSWEGNYKNGKMEGVSTDWYENGKKEREGVYKNDMEEGKFTEWDEDGNIVSEKNYKEGVAVE